MPSDFRGTSEPDVHRKNELSLCSPDNRTTNCVPGQLCKQTLDVINNMAPWSTRPFSSAPYAFVTEELRQERNSGVLDRDGSLEAACLDHHRE